MTMSDITVINVSGDMSMNWYIVYDDILVNTYQYVCNV